MDEFSTKWIKEFYENLVLPPPENDNDISGWTLTIQEFRKFSLAKELQNPSDTSAYGLKIYISVFNTKTGLFHGRTWTSPLITNNTNTFNISVHGLICGKESLIIIEFSLCLIKGSRENDETSLFFTVVHPFTSSQHICPLFSGTPRFLMHNPKDFASYLTTRPGELLIELKQYNDLIRGMHLIPLCTFMSEPPSGISSFIPLRLKGVFPLTISDIKLGADNDFSSRLKSQFALVISKKYNQEAHSLMLEVTKYSCQFCAHNGDKIVEKLYSADVSESGNWRFDGRFQFPKFSDDYKFVVLVQLVITVEFESFFLITPEEPRQEKKTTLDIPLGFSVFKPRKDGPITLDLCSDARLSPFGNRVCQISGKIPKISFNVSFGPAESDEHDINSILLEFPSLVSNEGKNLTMIDASSVADHPLLSTEINDPKNVNHILILFKFFIAKKEFFERFPIDKFSKVHFKVEGWKSGNINTDTVEITHLNDDIYYFKVCSSSDNKYGVFMSLDYNLDTSESFLGYFLLMRSNELQVQMIDVDSGIVVGNFNICTKLLLRQGKDSVQFSTHSDLVSTDGEFLGSIYYVAGCYATSIPKIKENEFKLRYHDDCKFIVAQSLMEVDSEFRKQALSSHEPPFELAIRYRDGKRRTIILTELQKRFLRTRVINPIPGVECRFSFVSSFEPEVDTFVTISIDDENLRFLGLTNMSDDYVHDYDNKLKLIRSTDTPFLQEKGLSMLEKLGLKRYPADKIVIRGGETISYDFSYLSIYDIVDKEVTVSFLNNDGEVVDLFTVQIKSPGTVVHENITIYAVSRVTLSFTLSTINNVKDSICSSELIETDATNYGVRVYSQPIDHSLRALVFHFSSDNTLIKVSRIVVTIIPSEVLTAGSRLKLLLKKFIGKSIVCKSNDNRIAHFSSHNVSEELQEPGEVFVVASLPGSAVVNIFDFQNRKILAQVLVNVSDENSDPNQQCLERINLKFKINSLSKRAIKYFNNTSDIKSIRLTTSHPSLVQFDPVHYDIDPKSSARIRFIFMPHSKEENVVIHIFIHENNSTKPAAEYYRCSISYEK